MAPTDPTCWTLIHAAARGEVAAREEFGRMYLPSVRAYLGARWRRPPLAGEVEDAAQEVFLDLLKPEGAIERAESGRAGGFRAFLYGVTRRVALRFEGRRARASRDARDSEEALADVAADDTGPASAFDRTWAVGVMRSATALHARRAEAAGEDAQRRYELLRLRFQEGCAIRQIAERWSVDPGWLHHQYARARGEFEAALVHVVGEHLDGTPAEVRRECARLVSLLG